MRRSSRTDEVNRRIVDIALKTPGVQRCNEHRRVLWRDASPTRSNAGAVFLVLDSFAKRAGDPDQSASGLQRKLNREFSGIQEAQVLVILPPPVAGIGNAGGFRMMIEDRAGRGSPALQEAVGAMMGKAAQTKGVAQVFSLFETRTPQLYLEIDRTKAQLLGVERRTCSRRCRCISARPTSTTSTCSAAPSASLRRRRANTAPIRRTCWRSGCAIQDGDTVPLGSFTTVRDISGPYRVPRYNLYPAAELDGAAAPGYSQGQAIEIMQKHRGGNAAGRLRLRMDDAGVPANARRQHRDLRLRARGGVRVPGAGRAVREPDAAARRHPDRADVPDRVDHRRRPAGQDNNILTQVGFIVLIALAAKNAILIVEFAKQLEDQGRDRFAAAVEAARLRLRPILMTSLAFIFGVTPLVWAVGAGAELRQTLGHAVFSGMIGVTVFGVIFTPVFYVVTRWIAERLKQAARSAGATRGGVAMAPSKFGFGQSIRRKEDDPLLRGARPLHRGYDAAGRVACRGGALAACACALPSSTPRKRRRCRACG